MAEKYIQINIKIGGKADQLSDLIGAREGKSESEQHAATVIRALETLDQMVRIDDSGKRILIVDEDENTVKRFTFPWSCD